MSPVTRAVCGVLGFSGVAAIAFHVVTKGGLEADFTFFASLLGGFVFLYAAFFGSLPWRDSGDAGAGQGEMSKSKWQMFWIAFGVFLAMATAFLAEKKVFQEADVVVFVIVGIFFTLVGIGLYLYIKSRGEDVDIKW